MTNNKSSSKRKTKIPPSSKLKRPRKSRKNGKSFPLVCLGASAGGLKAFEAFFSSLPEKSGIAFVVISHTDPDHASLLPDILKRKCRIPIKDIQEGTVPDQNTVYLPPSNMDAVVEEGRFHLKQRSKKLGLHMPIDAFLESLSREFGEKSGCVILSGTGTDGTHGLRLIKEAGGVSFAEAQSSAGHYGMPQSAIGTGLVDFVLEPDKMPEQLIEYFKHPVSLGDEAEVEGLKDKNKTASLKNILALLASRTQHDFSGYKKSTLIRRIERRMTVTRIKNADLYFRHLRGNNDEIDALFQELLIGVTEFFRDPETFLVLEERVLPDIFSRLDDEDTLRIWVAGCSTGEEVYSVSMVILEYMEKHQINNEMQIFGTDIDRQAIGIAREGVYLPNIAAKVSQQRLERFFVKENDRYRVRKEIREPVVFAVQDVLRDPPFTKLDLLFCRNLLIYLEAEAQNRLIPLFHYSIKPNGALFLGPSENLGRFGEFFTELDRKHVYFKKDAPLYARPEIHFPTGAKIKRDIPEPGLRAAGGTPKTKLGIAQATEYVLLQKHTPDCVIVDSMGHLLHVHGKTGKYLELSSGKPNLDVTSLAREGLRFALTSALRKATSKNKEICFQRLKVKTNSEFQETDIAVIPLSEPPVLKDAFMITFAQSPSRAEDIPKRDKSITESDSAADRTIELEQELLRTREDYRSAIEELETSNEELKSVNEEMHSANEELQSTNEELESSREELQSLNEELNTVNSQLQSKNEELADLYTSITDVLNSTGIAILFLNNDLTIKRFTPEAAGLLNLVKHDAGRPIEHISHNLEIDNLTKNAEQVLATLSPFESDVRTRDGHWYRMCIRIHRSKLHVIEGVVATFVNIDSQKKAQAKVEQLKENELEAAKRFSDIIVDAVRESLLVLDNNLYVLRVNRRFCEVFRTNEKETIGKSLFALENGWWSAPNLKELLEKTASKGVAFEDYAVEWKLPEIGKRQLLLNARRFVRSDDEEIRVLLAVDDISERYPLQERNR